MSRLGPGGAPARSRSATPTGSLFPEAGLTKLDLARHYAAVAEAMVPHVRGRPLALQGFPHGIGEGGLLHQGRAAALPRLDRDRRGPQARGRDDPPRAGQRRRRRSSTWPARTSITPHVWTSRADRLERPDRLIFDLDPSTQRFAEVRAAARAPGRPAARDRPGALRHDHRLARRARRRARCGARPTSTRSTPSPARWPRRWSRDDPDGLTAEFRRDKRGERIFVDVNRTAYGQHAVAPYAVRPLPGRPGRDAAALGGARRPRTGARGWTVGTIGERLAAAATRGATCPGRPARSGRHGARWRGAGPGGSRAP